MSHFFAKAIPANDMGLARERVKASPSEVVARAETKLRAVIATL